MSTETRQDQPRYWCHNCKAEVNIYMAPDPTCQQCNDQFIEEIQTDDDPREFLAGTDNHVQNMEGENIHLPGGGAAHIFSFSPSTGRLNNLQGNNSGEMGDEVFQFFTPRNNTTNNTATDDNERTSSTEGGATNTSPLSNIVQNILTNILGQNIDLSGQMPNTTTEGGNTGTDPTRPMMFYGSVVDGNMRFQPMPGSMPGGASNESENTNANTNEEGNAGTGATGVRANNITGILQFLSAMTGASLDAGLVGNPNDYVFSQTALDNIITQLMEQTGGASAPPPAPEQVIESLLKRNLTDKEKSTETDCAVCKDQFESHETVIELPCEHIFHDDCIKPWLKLNSTCPVCRHSVLPEQESNNDQNNNNTNNNNNSENNNTQNTQDTQDNQNTQNTQQTRETQSGNDHNTASFSWTSGNNGGNGTANHNVPPSFPLNLSAAFPWINSLTGNNASRSNNTSNGSNTNTNNTNPSTTNTDSNTTNSNTSTTNTNNTTQDSNIHFDDDLDLD